MSRRRYNLPPLTTLSAFEAAAEDVDAACFCLTHGFVFALEAGAPETDSLNARLVAHG